MFIYKNRKFGIKYLLYIVLIPSFLIYFSVIFWFLTKDPTDKTNDLITFFIIISAIFFIYLLIVIYICIKSIDIPFKNMKFIFKELTERNVNLDIETESTDEIGYLYKDMNNYVKSLNDLLLVIKKNIHFVGNYNENIKKVNEDFDSIISGQHKTMDTTNTKFTEFNESIINIDQKLKYSLKTINDSIKTAELSVTSIGELLENIQQIENTNKQINFILDLINNISEKTRLLSLNSAIEASRAGDTGKGFSIIAQEIRKLASQSHNASNEISILIRSNENKIHSGVNKTKEVLNYINNINSKIGEIGSYINEIFDIAEVTNKESDGMLINMKTYFEESLKNIKYFNAIKNFTVKIDHDIKNVLEELKTVKIKSKDRKTINDYTLYKQIKKAKKITKKTNGIQKTIDNIGKPKVLEINNISKKHKISENPETKVITKKTKIYKFPKIISSKKYNEKIINKLTSDEDKLFMQTLYTEDQFTDKFIIKNDATKEEKLNLIKILKLVKYY